MLDQPVYGSLLAPAPQGPTPHSEILRLRLSWQVQSGEGTRDKDLESEMGFRPGCVALGLFNLPSHLALRYLPFSNIGLNAVIHTLGCPGKKGMLCCTAWKCFANSSPKHMLSLVLGVHHSSWSPQIEVQVSPLSLGLAPHLQRLEVEVEAKSPSISAGV